MYKSRYSPIRSFIYFGLGEHVDVYVDCLKSRGYNAKKNINSCCFSVHKNIYVAYLNCTFPLNKYLRLLVA